MSKMQDVYTKSFSEVYAIINLMPEKLKEKIPEKFKEFITKEKSDTYSPSINLPIDDTKLMPETIAIMGMIYRDFLVTKDKKEKLVEEDRIEMEEYEKRLIQKYPPSNLFQNKEETKEKEENLEITEYKKDSLFCKLKKLIKKIFGIL